MDKTEIAAIHTTAIIIFLYICFSPINYLTDFYTLIILTFSCVDLFLFDTIKRLLFCQYLYNYHFYNGLEHNTPKQIYTSTDNPSYASLIPAGKVLSVSSCSMSCAICVKNVCFGFNFDTTLMACSILRCFS